MSRKKQIRTPTVIADNWFKSYWRPSMAWLYMLICLCDFVIFPILTMLFPELILKAGGPVSLANEYIQWRPITLVDGGLIHLAFGGILGVSAWSRGQEKINDDNMLPGQQGYFSTMPMQPGQMYPQQMGMNNGYGSPPMYQPPYGGSSQMGPAVIPNGGPMSNTAPVTPGHHQHNQA